MDEAGTHGMSQGRSEREVLWFDLPAGGTECERSWVARLPDTEVVRLGELDADDPDADGATARPLTSFVLRRSRGWSRHAASDRRWVASVGLHSDLTAQAGRLRRSGRVHHLVFAWDSDPDLPEHTLGPRAEAWRSARESDLVVCLSDVTRSRLLDAGAEPERVRVVRPGVDTRRFAPSPRPPEEEPIAVFADPLTRGHGIGMVL